MISTVFIAENDRTETMNQIGRDNKKNEIIQDSEPSGEIEKTNKRRLKVTMADLAGDTNIKSGEMSTNSVTTWTLLKTA